MPDDRILIAGGGPAGSAAAITLLREGHAVTLFERKWINREKFCGDGLIRDAQKALGRLGVFDAVRREALEIPRVTAFGFHDLRFRFPSHFFTLQRTRLDQILRDRIEELGGTVVYNSPAADAEITEDRAVVTDSDRRRHEGACLILATGSNMELAGRLGFRPDPRHAVSIRAYGENNLGLDSYVLWFHESARPGYGWIFPVPGDRINLGVYSDEGERHQNLKDLFAKFVSHMERHFGKSVRLLTELKGGMLRTGLAAGPLTGQRVVLVGENINTTLNFLGEGVGKALQSGIVAGEVIHGSGGDYSREALGIYDRRIREEFGPIHEGYAKAGKLSGNLFFHLLYSALFAHSEKMRNKMADLLDEKALPDELFTFRGLVRTLFF